MSSIAIIPARGGSKRIPKKNIKKFCGVPIIKYSIDVAMQSMCFDEVMVSTDDEEIASLAKSFGAVVPFYRSIETSNDYCGISEVIYEVVTEYEKRGKQFDKICIILPTAPFITRNRIMEGLNLLLENHVNAVIAVARYSYPVQRSFIVRNKSLCMLWPENYDKRSQDLEPVYHDAGQFYWIDTVCFMQHKKILSDRNAYIEIPEIEAQDIDTESDWNIAELKYSILRQK